MTIIEDQTNTTPQVVEPKRRRVSFSLASTVKRGDNMSAGIVEHLETLSPKGHYEAYVQEFNTLVNA